MEEKPRATPRFAHFDRDVNTWQLWPPGVGEARLSCCPVCEAPAILDGRIILHGHGLRKRALRGPLEPGGEPYEIEVLVRRYQCQRCKASPLAKNDPPLLAKSRPPKSNLSRQARPTTPPSLGGRPEPRRPCGRCPASARAGSAVDGSSRTRELALASACAVNPHVSGSDTVAHARTGDARTRRTRRPSDCADGCESRSSRCHPRSWPDFGSTWCET